MKVWLLETGCRYEGGSVLEVFATEQAGIAAAIKYMKEEVLMDAVICMSPESTDVGTTVSGYSYDEPKDGMHTWTQHLIWTTQDGSVTGSFKTGGSQYVRLMAHELK